MDFYIHFSYSIFKKKGRDGLHLDSDQNQPPHSFALLVINLTIATIIITMTINAPAAVRWVVCAAPW